MRALQTAERQSRTKDAVPASTGVTIFDYDDNLVSETETIARFLDCGRDLSINEIFVAR
jgi:hypothetical protein